MNGRIRLPLSVTRKNIQMKTFYISLFALLLSASLHAQRGLEVGAFIQPQIYGQYYNTPPEGRLVKLAYSLSIGGDAGYNFTDNFGIRTGFIYGSQGEKYNIAGTKDETAHDLNLEYIEIPLYLKFNTSPENLISYLAIAGPYAGFLNNANLTIDTDDPETVLSQYKRFVPGVAVGIGIQLNLDQGGNLNLLWRSNATIDTIQSVGDVASHNIGTSLQLSYHYFITI